MDEVFVLGAGFMGSGIAQVAALSGYRVTLADLSQERLEDGLQTIRDSLRRMTASGKVPGEQAERLPSEIRTSTSIEDARSADLVLEAVPEDASLKRGLFAALEEVCGNETVLATNTSAIPVSLIAGATRRPERVVATHFFGPVPVMRLCEVAGGLLTSEATVSAAERWARSLGKETVRVRGDIAGFLANRVTIPSSLEAVRMVDEGAATSEEIDRALAAFGVKVGPMRIMDNAGIDVSLSAAEAIYQDTGDPAFLCPPLLKRMVASGLLGRKSGAGFYDYSSGEAVAREIVSPVHFEASLEEADGAEGRAAVLFNRFYTPTIIESVKLLEAGKALPEDIDRAVRLGFNFPLGPLQVADLLGIDRVVETAGRLERQTGALRFRTPSLLERMVAAGHLGSACGAGFYLYPPD